MPFGSHKASWTFQYVLLLIVLEIGMVLWKPFDTLEGKKTFPDKFPLRFMHRSGLENSLYTHSPPTGAWLMLSCGCWGLQSKQPFCSDVVSWRHSLSSRPPAHSARRWSCSSPATSSLCSVLFDNLHNTLRAYQLKGLKVGEPRIEYCVKERNNAFFTDFSPPSWSLKIK